MAKAPVDDAKAAEAKEEPKEKPKPKPHPKHSARQTRVTQLEEVIDYCKKQQAAHAKAADNEKDPNRKANELEVAKRYEEFVDELERRCKSQLQQLARR